MSGYSSLTDEHKAGVWGVVAFALALIVLRALELNTVVVVIGAIGAGLAGYFVFRAKHRRP